MVLAGLDAGQSHGDVGHGDEEDLVDPGGALATEAVGGLGAHRVILEAREPDVAVRLVLDEAVGPGADVLLDGIVAGGVDDVLGIDHRAVVRPGQPHEQRAGRLLEIERHRRRVLHLEALDVLPELLARRRQPPPALQRGHHVGRGQLLAVVELDAPAEPERVRAPLVGHGVAVDQQRDRVVAPVVRVESLEHVPGDLLHDHRRGRVQVERGRLADRRHPQHAAGPRRLLGRARRGRGHRERQRQPDGDETEEGSFHVGPFSSYDASRVGGTDLRVLVRLPSAGGL